jgi:hypothetical protein
VTANGQSIGRTVADPQGQWVLLPTDPVRPGGEELAVIAIAPGGQQTKGAAPVLLLVPEPPKTADANAPPPAGSAPAMAILLPPDAAPRFLKGAPPGEVRLGLDVVDYDQRGTIRFSGTAPPGVTVRIYIDNVPGGDAVADPTGHWSMTPESAVAAARAPAAAPAPTDCGWTRFHRSAGLPRASNCRFSGPVPTRSRRPMCREAGSWCSRAKACGGLPVPRTAAAPTTSRSIRPIAIRSAIPT